MGKTKRYEPCKGCAERYIGCHSDCEKYAVYRKLFDERAEEKRRARESNDFRHDGMTKSLRLAKNNKHR